MATNMDVKDDLLDAAIKYAEMGYRVFPLRIGTKLPATKRGCLDATSDLGLIESTWGDLPYNIGIATDDLVVVDIDGQGNPWLSNAEDADRATEIANCPIALTPRGGSHRYFQKPSGKTFRNTASVLAPGVDTRADGGYVVAPPSNLSKGGGYRWLDGCELVPFSDLPCLPSWVAKELIAYSGSSKTRNTSQAGSQGGVQFNADPIDSGRRNDTLSRIGGCLRRYGLDYDALNAALQSQNITRCKPPLDQSEVERIAKSVSRYDPDYAAVMTANNAPINATQSAPTQPFPKHLLKPPGLISDIIDYNFAGAQRKQPILALCGAIALVSTIAGRAIQDERGTRTNLYLLAVAGSGAGKERARQVNKKLLQQAGAKALIGPEAPASAAGLITAVNVSPVTLFQWDEIGRLLTNINSKNANPHLTGIITVLMKLFTSAGDVFLGDAYADAKRNIEINQPHAVLHGTTVNKNLYSNLTADSVTDGFMGRLLVFESEDEAPDYEDLDISKIPSTSKMVATIQDWLAGPSGGGNLAAQFPQPTILKASPAARVLWKDFLDYCLTRERDKSDSYRALWSRAAEKARKLALVHCCSCGTQEVDEAAAEWGIALATHLTSKLASVGDKWISENPYEETCKRVIRFVEGRGTPCSMSDLVRGPLRAVRKREREEIVSHIAELGLLSTYRQQTKGRYAQMFSAATGGIYSQGAQQNAHQNGKPGNLAGLT